MDNRLIMKQIRLLFEQRRVFSENELSCSVFERTVFMKKHLFLLGILGCLVPATAQPLPSFVKDSLDRYVTKAMSDWQIPGLAVGIVKDGKLIFSKGYGLREMGKPDPVDANTLFMMASNSDRKAHV